MASGRKRNGFAHLADLPHNEPVPNSESPPAGVTARPPAPPHRPNAPDAVGRPERGESDVRHTFERVVSELLRKGLDAGRGSFERVGESIAPKEIASGILSHLGDLRSGIVRAVAQEVGRFLREADVAAEVRNILDGLGVEAKVELRYRSKKKTEPEADASTDEARRPRARAQRSPPPSST